MASELLIAAPRSIKSLAVRLRDTLSEVGSAESLRFRAIRASGWAIGAHFSNRVLRLGGNLILTRLLFPSAFGLMAIVQSVLTGLRMFSDIGVEASIIQNKRGHEAAFINTAWTVQIVQGVLIWIGLCALALPVASFYHQPLLAKLLPVVGIGAVIGGFDSTKLALSTRSLALKRRVLVEVGSYAVGLTLMVVLAWITRSLWALVYGGLIGTLAKTVASHVLLEGTNNRLALERGSFRELFGFGQWVLASSVITFLVGEGSKLLVGALIGVKLLAFVTLASTMSGLYLQVIQQLNSYVLFPAYSEIVRTRPHRLSPVAARSRLLFIGPGWAVALFFVIWGGHLMHLLYDRRYAESGPMLQIFAMGELVGILGQAYTGLLWAKGMVRASAMLLSIQVGIQFGGMLVGHYFLGYRGVIVGAAITGWLIYPVTAWIHGRIGLWQPKIDLPFIAASVVVVLFAFHYVYPYL